MRETNLSEAELRKKLEKLQIEKAKYQVIEEKIAEVEDKIEILKQENKHFKEDANCQMQQLIHQKNEEKELISSLVYKIEQQKIELKEVNNLKELLIKDKSDVNLAFLEKENQRIKNRLMNTNKNLSSNTNLKNEAIEEMQQITSDIINSKNQLEASVNRQMALKEKINILRLKEEEMVVSDKKKNEKLKIANFNKETLSSQIKEFTTTRKNELLKIDIKKNKKNDLEDELSKDTRTLQNLKFNIDSEVNKKVEIEDEIQNLKNIP